MGKFRRAAARGLGGLNDELRRWHRHSIQSAQALHTMSRIESRLMALGAQVQELNEDVAQHDDRLDVVRKLAAQVEPYQPIYGLEGIINNPSRNSIDRARAIEIAIEPVRGRRILDIGSSLGFMSFYLADRGAFLEGWESNAANVEVAKAIARVNGLRVCFRATEMNLQTVQGIPPGRFDVILVLSVLHHIIHSQGLDAAQTIVAELLQRVPFLVCELASQGENTSLTWDRSQPQDPMAVLGKIPAGSHVRRLGEFSTHLSDRDRPLVLVQAPKFVRVGAHTYSYDSVTNDAYTGSMVSFTGVQRRYFTAARHIIKEYRFPDLRHENYSQMAQELYVYSQATSGSGIHHGARIEDVEISSQHARLVLSRIRGQLLDEVSPLPVARLRSVLLDVLRTLTDLETRGLHHNDVRSWNILVNDEGGWLIDFGRASHVAVEDDAIALAWAVVAGVTGQREPLAEGKTSLPDLTVLEGTEAEPFAQSMRHGKRRAQDLLDALIRHDSEARL